MSKFPTFVAVLTLFLSACNVVIVDDDSHIDGQYRLTLSGLYADCPEEGFYEEYYDESVSVEVFRRNNGLVDLFHSADILPGSTEDYAIWGMSLRRGNLHLRDYWIDYWGNDISTSIDGVLTPNNVSFSFEERVNDCYYGGFADGYRRIRYLNR